MTVTAMANIETITTASIRHRLSNYLKGRLNRVYSMSARDTFSLVQYEQGELRGAIDLAYEVGAINWDTRSTLIRANSDIVDLHGAMIKWHKCRVSERNYRPDLNDHYEAVIVRVRLLAKSLAD
jgi:hypothetical protein